MKKVWFSRVATITLALQIFMATIYAEPISYPEKEKLLSDIMISLERTNIDNVSIKIAKEKAEAYITNMEPNNRWWNKQNPKLTGAPAPYYTDDLYVPFIYEWKVTCDNANDCGSIMVAVIDKEARVVEAGNFGKANYESLTKGKIDKQNKLYYFSPFEQYIESIPKDSQSKKIASTVESIDPSEDIKIARENLMKLKEQVKTFRSQNKIQFYNAPAPNQEEKALYATTTALASVGFVPPFNTSNGCNSYVPCYDQFYQYYNNQWCSSGCGPTAMAIIFGYHDNRGSFPNLFPGVAPAILDGNVQSIVNEIRGYMGTFCSNGGGATLHPGITQGMEYARQHGYPNSLNGVVTLKNQGLWLMFARIKNQIQSGNPVIGSITQHYVVIYGYYDSGDVNTSYVYVNRGWGPLRADRWIPINDQFIIDDDTGNPSGLWRNLGAIITLPIR